MAVGFQVVLIVGQADVVVPENLSAAVNYNCVRCLTYALASQLVLTLDGPLSADGTARLNELWREIAEFGTNMQDVPLSEIQDRLSAYKEQIMEVIRPIPAPRPGSPAGPATSPAATPTTTPSTAPSTTTSPTPGKPGAVRERHATRSADQRGTASPRPAPASTARPRERAPRRLPPLPAPQRRSRRPVSPPPQHRPPTGRPHRQPARPPAPWRGRGPGIMLTPCA